MSILTRLFSAPLASSLATQGTETLVSPWALDHGLERMVISDLYPEGVENLPLTRAAAMRLPALAKGVRIITTTIARCPLTASRGTQTVDAPLFTQLTPGVPNSVVIAAMLDGLIFHGRAWLVVTAWLSTGYPRHVRVVPEAEAETSDGRLIRAFGHEVPAGAWLRIDALTEGILTSGAQTIRDAIELRSAASEAGAVPVPSVILKATDPVISPEELEELQAKWVAARRRRHGSAAAVNPGVEPVIVPATKADVLLGGMNASVLDVARLLGLPAWSLDGAVEGSSLSYSNSASRMRELVEFGLAPYITALEDGLSMLLPQGQALRVDTSELVNSDRASRLADYDVGIRIGLYTVPEIRAWEGLAPLPETETGPAPEPDPEPAPTEKDTEQ